MFCLKRVTIKCKRWMSHIRWHMWVRRRKHPIFLSTSIVSSVTAPRWREASFEQRDHRPQQPSDGGQAHHREAAGGQCEFTRTFPLCNSMYGMGLSFKNNLQFWIIWFSFPSLNSRVSFDRLNWRLFRLLCSHCLHRNSTERTVIWLLSSSSATSLCTEPSSQRWEASWLLSVLHLHLNHL